MRFHYPKAQVMLEYLLVMAVVVMIVFMAFKKGGGGVLEQTHGKVNAYFDTGTTAIMGGYWDKEKNTFVRVDPSPIHGGWCAWTTCINGYKSRECACPRSAFGGAACSGNAAESCGSNGGQGACVSTGCPSGHGVACGENVYDNCNKKCGKGTLCPAPSEGCTMICKSSCLEEC